jgi:hypothetical protein
MSRKVQRQGRKTSVIGVDALEDRLVLSQVIQGVDIDGDQWFLRLVGPGQIRVINQPDGSGNPVPLGTPALIQSIELAGTAPLTSRLIGEVKKADGGDGKVWFQQLTQFGGDSLTDDSNNGVYGIDIPDFWLGITSSATTAQTALIKIDNGVNTLRFGGADFTASPGAGIASRSSNAVADSAVVQLGIPSYLGTSIFVDKFVTDTKAGTTAGTFIQDSVTVEVIGRLNAFQANEIGGTTTQPSTGFVGGGGTVVKSSGEYLGQAIQTSIVGAIGEVMVRGNATNFGVQSGTSIRRLNIGGETRGVFGLGVTGIRYAQFGLGMDDVVLHAHTMSRLEANRGAVGSEVKVSRQLGYFRTGGDVIDSVISSGLQQDLTAEFRQQTANSDTPAELGGAIHALIGGSIVDSVFAASFEPFNGEYDSAYAMALTGGKIEAKVTGTVDNTGITPYQPTKAFYAQNVEQSRGPVTPPMAPSTPAESPAKFTRNPSGNFVVLGRPFPSNKKIPATFALRNVAEFLNRTNPRL